MVRTKREKGKQVGVTSTKLTLLTFTTPQQFLESVWPKIVASKNGLAEMLLFFYQRRSEDLNLEAVAENSDSLDDYSLNLLAMYLKRYMGNIIQQCFTDILESFDLKQRVCAGTHRNGHTLDLLINKSDDNMLNNIKVYDPNISDHLAVMCDVSIRKPQFRKEVIFYRKLRSLDMESFLSDVADCPLVIDPSSDLDHLVQQYDTLLRSIMDKHAPVNANSCVD